MPSIRSFQTNFSGGLLSEGMEARIDLAQYESGCRQYDNWWPNITGGGRRRPGTRFLYDTGINKGRLEPFIFDDNEQYVVNLKPSTIDIFDEEGALVDQVAWSVPEANILTAGVTQKGDVMFIATGHATHGIKKLVRTSLTTFVLQNFEFEQRSDGLETYIPFWKFASPEAELTPSGVDGNIELTSSEAVFTANHVGSIIRYRDAQILITNYISTTVVAGDVIDGLPDSQQLNTTGGNNRNFIIGEILVGRDSGAKGVVHSRRFRRTGQWVKVLTIAGKFGTSEEIEGLDSGSISNMTSADDIDPLPSANWDEQAFSLARGWPSAIEFHSQRLWLGGSSSLPATIFGSKVAAFFNFDTGDGNPDEAIIATIASKRVNKIVNIISGRNLQVLTDAAEFYAPHSDDRPLTPETFNLLPQSKFGSRPGIQAKVLDDSTIFVQNSGNAIREFTWRDRLYGYTSAPISALVDEFINDIVEIEVLYGGYDRPEQLIFVVNGDGTCMWYHSDTQENIKRWGRWTTDGAFHSFCSINDTLYALIKREVNGIDRYLLERFEFDLTMDQCYDTIGTSSSYVFAALAPGLVGAAVVNGVMDTQPVWNGSQFVYTPDHDIGPVEINGAGDITIKDNASVFGLIVGRPFIQTLEPMPVEVQDRNGITIGLPKRLVSVDVLVVSTLAMSLDGERLKTYQLTDDWTKKPTAVKKNAKFYTLGYSERPTVVIENDRQLPCEVLGLGMEVEY